MSDCLFCKIIAGQIPSNKVYEDEFTYAFHDIAPQAKTHVLVVSKKHIPDVAHCAELSDEHGAMLLERGDAPLDQSLALFQEGAGLVRRCEKELDPGSLSRGPITVEEDRRRVTRDGREIELTMKEFDLIVFLMKNPGRVYSRENLLDLVTRIKNIKDICPTCGQKLQGVEKPHVEPFLIEMEELQKDLSVVDNLIAQINSEKNSEKTKLVDFYNLSNTVTTNDLNSLKIKYSCLINDQKNLISDINIMQSEYNNLQASIASIDATIESLNSSIIHNQEELVTLSSELEYNNTQKDIQQSHLDIISKFETALKRDFRGYLLTTIIDYISSRAKEYCNVIFETDKITFGLDGNNIEISYLDKAYENLSGGEKQKIDLIIQFSIRDMLCNHLGFTSNILVLDEVFDGLDMFGCQKVLDVISAMTDVKNIFIVTHRKDLSIPTDKEIVVIKNSNGISELR